MAGEQTDHYTEFSSRLGQIGNFRSMTIYAYTNEG